MPFAFETDDSVQVTPGGFGEGRIQSDIGFAFERQPSVFTPAVSEVLQQSPDEAAKINTLSQQSGLPVADVQANPAAVKADIQLQELNDSTADVPATRQWLLDVDNLSVAHDEVQNLGAIERLMRKWNEGASTVALGKAGTELRASPDDPGLQLRVKDLQDKIAKIGGDPEDGFVGYLGSAAKVLGQMSETMITPGAAAAAAGGAGTGALVGAAGFSLGPLGFATTGAGALTGAGVGLGSYMAWESYSIEGGNAYLEMLNKGIDPKVAGYLSHGVGVANAALELAGTAIILKPFSEAGKLIIKKKIAETVMSKTGMELATKAATYYGAALVGETGTEVMQEVVNIAAEEIGKSYTSEELAKITPEEFGARVGEIAVETLKAMSVLAAPGPGVHVTAELTKARRAQQNQETLDEAVETAQTSKLAQRDPARLADFLGKTMEQQGTETFYVPADKLIDWMHKTNNDEAVINSGVYHEMHEAALLGQDVAIPADKFARNFLVNEKYSSLSDHIRQGMDEMTPAEAAEYAESGVQQDIADVEARSTWEPAQTDEAVDIAEHEMGLKALFGSADEVGMTPTKYEAYLASIERAKTEGAIRQQDKVLAQQQRELTTEWQTELELEREQARETMSGLPHYQAFNGIGLARLDRTELKAITDELGLKLEDLPSQTGGRRIYTQVNEETGLSVAEYAELYGFDSPLQMVWDINYHPSFDEAIEQTAHKNMLAKHGDLNDRRMAVIAARESLHNDVQASVLGHELDALRAATGQKRVGQRVLNRAAKQRLKTIPVRDASPQKFLASAARNAKEASRAVKAGKLPEAADFKFRQAINFHMAKHAYAMNKKLEDQRTYLAKFEQDRESHQKMPTKHLMAIRELLDKVSFRPKPTATSLTKMLSAVANAEVDPANVDKKYIDAVTKINYRDMTVGDFQEMVNTVKEIEHKGKTENKLRQDHDKREVDLISSFVVREMADNLKIDSKAAGEQRGRIDAARRFGKHAITLMLSMDSIVRHMDGFKDLGVVYQNTKGRIDRALSRGYQTGQVGFLRRQQNEAKRIKKIFSVFTAGERKDMNDKIRIEGVHRDISHHTVLSVLLNSGNDGNMQALIEGKNFSEEEIVAIHNHASKKDWDFAQSVWDYLDEFFPEVKETVSRRSNRIVEQVEGRDIETKHGTYRGGYYPIRYDKRKSLLENTGTDAVEELINHVKYGTFTASHTADGHTKARSEANGAQLNLDLFVLNSHVNQVIFDLEMGDAIRDMYRVWYHKDIRQTFSDMGYQHYWEHGDLWLRDTIQQELVSNNAFEQGLRWLRTGFTVSKLGWNVGVAAMQPIGLIQSSVAIGHSHMMRGLRTFLASKWKGENSIFKFVESQSGFMAARQDTFNKDILDSKTMIGSKLLPGWLQDTFFWGIKVTQRVTDVITWLAAYDKGIRQFEGNHQMAVDLGDRMVSRAQASGIFSERTAMERGSVSRDKRQHEGVRVWTAMISYFAAKSNVAWERTKKTDFRNPIELVKWGTDMMLLYIVEALIAGLVTGQIPNEDDDEGVISWLAKETFSTFAAGVPIFREAVSAAKGFQGGGVVGSVAGDLGRAVGQISQGEVDAAALKAINNVGGSLFHYPSAEVNKFIEAGDRALNDDDVSIHEWIMGPHFKR